MQPYNSHVVRVREHTHNNIADPLSRFIDGKAGEPEHKHEVKQYNRFVAINATPETEKYQPLMMNYTMRVEPSKPATVTITNHMQYIP